mmetsp:Transcript_11519/g.28380  ORF Transcript_11519/g.28380 Transcript_11519/m.28380 type:complete len:144 (-) Transcript_11519:121-552(-)
MENAPTIFILLRVNLSFTAVLSFSASSIISSMRFFPSRSGVIGGQGLERSDGRIRRQPGVLGPRGEVYMVISRGVLGGGDVNPDPILKLGLLCGGTGDRSRGDLKREEIPGVNCGQRDKLSEGDRWHPDGGESACGLKKSSAL